MPTGVLLLHFETIESDELAVTEELSEEDGEDGTSEAEDIG